MKIIICIVIVFAAIQFAFAQKLSDLNRLVATEKAFAKMAKDQTVKQAFLEFLADDGIVFEPTAVNGKTAWTARRESPSLLSWNPVWADISSGGKIGYTTGDWEFRPKGKDDDPVAFGQYITIWKAQTDGNFRAILDIGISHEKPGTIIKTWSSPNASDNSEPDLKSTPNFAIENVEGFIAEDIRLYREGKFPFIGKDPALIEIRNERVKLENTEILIEKCETIEDLSYCYGEIKRTMNDGSKEMGNLVQIRKFRNGDWQIVLDIYTPLPAK